MTKIFVGNLPFSATSENVGALFAQHGKVETISLITDRDTGSPRGFGFIDMSASDAARAIQNLNGQDFEGRALKVSQAEERGNNRRGGPRRF
jgi:RNA recognition motif-containing protein